MRILLGMIAFGICASTPVQAGAVYANQVSAQTMRVTAEGGVLVGGSSTGDALQQQFAVLKLGPDGQPDATFGAGGKVFTDISPDCEFIQDLEIDSAGRILVIGTAGLTGCTRELAGNRKVMVVRYLANGALDLQFGGTGIVSPFATYGMAAAVLTVGNDNYVAANDQGTLGAASSVTRLAGNGTIDATFGTSGTVTLNHAFSDTTRSCSVGMVRQLKPTRDGTHLLVVGGKVCNGPDGPGNYMTVTRMRFDGSFDPTFGEAGTAYSYSTRYGAVSATDLEEMDDGSMLIAGEYHDGNIGGTEARWIAHRFSADGKAINVTPYSDEIGIRMGNGLNRLAGIELSSSPNLCQFIGSAMDWGSKPTDRGFTYELAAAVLDGNGFPSHEFGLWGRSRVEIPRTSMVNVWDGQRDGSGDLVAVGSGWGDRDYMDAFVVARLLANGTPDPGFGSGGHVLMNMVPSGFLPFEGAPSVSQDLPGRTAPTQSVQK